MRCVTAHNAADTPLLEFHGDVFGNRQRHGGVVEHARHDDAGGGGVGAVQEKGLASTGGAIGGISGVGDACCNLR